MKRIVRKREVEREGERERENHRKMRDTVLGIISLPRTIRATLDDLNGPEVTFLSLSAPFLAPLCLRRLVPRYQTVYDDSPRLQPVRGTV